MLKLPFPIFQQTRKLAKYIINVLQTSFTFLPSCTIYLTHEFKFSSQSQRAQASAVIPILKMELDHNKLIIENTNDNTQINGMAADLSRLSLNQQSNIEHKKEEDEVKTPFPYSKKQISSIFKQKHIPYQKIYNLYQCKLFLKEKLSQMSDYGYDFKYKQWTFKPARSNGKPYWKQMRRKVYVKMQCQNCKQKGKNKKWTSILGLAEIKFCITDFVKFLKMFPKFQSRGKTPEQQSNKMKYKKIVQWQLHFYRMKCATCQQWGTTHLYQKQLQALSLSFCWLISQILEGVKISKRHQDDRYKNQDVHKHLQSFCEACELGKCFNISKTEKGKTSD